MLAAPRIPLGARPQGGRALQRIGILPCCPALGLCGEGFVQCIHVGIFQFLVIARCSGKPAALFFGGELGAVGASVPGLLIEVLDDRLCIGISRHIGVPLAITQDGQS